MNIKYVDNQSDLVFAVEKLQESKEIAIDLEFDKNHYRYGFNLCLIQVFDKETCYLIDPIKTKIDLKPFYVLIESPAIEKVCFAFGEDMRLLHHLGCFPKNVNDLATVRSLLNYPPLSLSNMLKEVLGMESEKNMQKSNWFKRPLSEDQIQYAAEDVLFLFELKDTLMQKAESLNRLAWIKEENSVLDTIIYPPTTGVINIKNNEKKLLSEFEWHILEGLLQFREKTAEKLGKPSYQIIHKDILSEIARGKVFIKDWKKIKGIFRSVHTTDYQYRIDVEHRRLISEAEKLKKSKVASAVKPMDRQLRAEMKQKRAIAEEVKKITYDPIKTELIAQYGSEFATFVMPNHVIMTLSMNKSSEILPYRLSLIKSLGENLGIKVNYA